MRWLLAPVLKCGFQEKIICISTFILKPLSEPGVGKNCPADEEKSIDTEEEVADPLTEEVIRNVHLVGFRIGRKTLQTGIFGDSLR